MTRPGKKAQLQVSVDNDVMERLRELAEKDDRSLSSYVNRVLKKHVAQEKKKDPK